MIQAPAEDATREELVEYCRKHDMHHHHRNSVETLRVRIKDALMCRELRETPQQEMQANGDFTRGDRPKEVREAFEHFRRENSGKAAILRRYMAKLEKYVDDPNDLP